MTHRNASDHPSFAARLAPRAARFAAALSAMSVALVASCASMADTAQTTDEIVKGATPILYGADGMTGANNVIGLPGATTSALVLSVSAPSPGVVEVTYAFTTRHTFYPPPGSAYLNVLPASQQNSQQRGTSTLTLYAGSFGSPPTATLVLTAKLESGLTWLSVSSYSDTTWAGATSDPSWFVVSAAAKATGVTASGTLSVDQTLTGAYTYQGASNAAESGSTYQWYAVDAGVRTAIEGATAQTLVIPASLADREVQFCVTPRNSRGAGVESCSGSYLVVGRAPRLTWYSQSDQQGVATVANPAETANGQCVTNATVSTLGALRSYSLTARGAPVTIDVFQTNNCGIQAWTVRHTKTVAANTTGTFSFGSGFVARSYRVSW
jgi:hypothetical protein